MARIVGGVTTSHIPAIGNAMTDKLEETPYWKRFFDGYEPAKEWLAKVDPDIAIVVYNDHGLNFFLDNMPTFALGCADRYDNADEGWGLKTLASFTVTASDSGSRPVMTRPRCRISMPA
jgi:protocatechuate 4,5-dioxygenase beta chain